MKRRENPIRESQWQMAQMFVILLVIILGFVSLQCSEDSEAFGDENKEGNEGGNNSENDNEINGPTISVPVSGDDNSDQEICTGDLAERTFRFALCTCRNATAMGVLRTGSFDSLLNHFITPDFAVDAFGGAIGVNRDLAVPGVLEVGGSAILAGPEGVALPGKSSINGDLKADGDVEFAGVLNVWRDMVAGDDFVNFGVAHIGQDLYLGGNMIIPGLTTPNGEIITGPIDVAPPCPCSSQEILDISSIVEGARHDNDNDAIALEEDRLQVIIGYVTVELPPGRFFLSGVAGAGKLTLKVTGRTALFVDGDFMLTGDLEIDVADNAELDIFITDDLHIVGANDFGQIAKPSAVRFYVGGHNDVTLTGYTSFVGNLYAPNATVILTGANYVFGAIFAGDILAMGDTGIHYDRDIYRAGEDCEDKPPPPPPPGEDDDEPKDPGDNDEPGDNDDPEDDEPDDNEICLPYGEQCEDDADCCEPLVCENSVCRPLGPVI